MGPHPLKDPLSIPQRCLWTYCRRWACRMAGMAFPSLPGSARSARGPKTPISLSMWIIAPSSAHPPGSSSPVRHGAAAGVAELISRCKPSRSEGKHPLFGVQSHLSGCTGGGLSLMVSFLLQMAPSPRISPSWPRCVPGAEDKLSCSPSTTSEACSSWAWRSDSRPSSSTRTRRGGRPPSSTPFSAGSTWPMAGEWPGTGGGDTTTTGGLSNPSRCDRVSSPQVAPGGVGRGGHQRLLAGGLSPPRHAAAGAGTSAPR